MDLRAEHLRLSLASAARDAADRVALVDDDREWTFSALYETDRGAFAPPHAQLFRPLAQDSESIRAVLVCIDRGVPFVGVHPRWTRAERAERRAALAPALLVESFTTSATIDPGPRLNPPIDAPAAILFTSGTSGSPRALVLSRRAFVASALASASAIPLAPGDRWMLSMPPAHVGGVSIVTRCLLQRATVVVDPGPFDATRWIERVERLGVTHASVVPTMLKRIVDRARRSPGSLRHLIVGGASCDDVLARRALDLGYPVQRTYGATETCSMVAVERSPLAGGVGAPLASVSVRIVDDEICVAAPMLADGHLDGGAIAPLARDDDGYFHTRDRGSIDEAGNLHVYGRADDVIISGGENVHPARVEAALESVHGVVAAAAYGVADAEWGEVVHAAVVLDGISVDGLDRELRTRLASYALPRRYVVLDAAPSLPGGKLDRRAFIARARSR